MSGIEATREFEKTLDPEKCQSVLNTVQNRKRFNVQCLDEPGHSGEHWSVGLTRSVYWDSKHWNEKTQRHENGSF